MDKRIVNALNTLCLRYSMNFMFVKSKFIDCDVGFLKLANVRTTHGNNQGGESDELCVGIESRLYGIAIHCFYSYLGLTFAFVAWGVGCLGECDFCIIRGQFLVGNRNL